MNRLVLPLLLVAVLGATALGTHAFAHSGGIEVERSTVQFSVDAGNTLPWGYVSGVVNNAVPGYPVVIQIYGGDPVHGNSAGAVHFAQTDVNADGSFEYRFRVLDITDGSRINIFEGDYTVQIFKVVYSNLGSV